MKQGKVLSRAILKVDGDDEKKGYRSVKVTPAKAASETARVKAQQMETKMNIATGKKTPSGRPASKESEAYRLRAERQKKLNQKPY